MAEDKIAQAEHQAVADVKAIAAEAAAKAAEALLGRAATGDVADRLISNAIGEVKTKLN